MKTISMEYSEYRNELDTARTRGYQEGFRTILGLRNFETKTEKIIEILSWELQQHEINQLVELFELQDVYEAFKTPEVPF